MTIITFDAGKLYTFVWIGDPLPLATAPFRANLQEVFALGPMQVSYISYAPDNDFPSLKQFEPAPLGALARIYTVLVKTRFTLTDAQVLVTGARSVFSDVFPVSAGTSATAPQTFSAALTCYGAQYVAPVFTAADAVVDGVALFRLDGGAPMPYDAFNAALAAFLEADFVAGIHTLNLSYYITSGVEGKLTLAYK